MPEITMRTTSGEFTLVRPHASRSSALRAWSAADVLVVDELCEQKPDMSALGRLLLVNDEFGALTCAFATAAPTLWTDSAVSRSAIAHNLQLNGLPPLPAERMIHGHQQPTGVFDTVVIKVPKTSALLEYQLQTICAVAQPSSVVIGAGMVRHIHSSTVEAFERLVGPTTTSRATRKARLIFSTPGGMATPGEQLPVSGFITSTGTKVVELPGTFSAGHLDVGSALLLETLREQPQPEPSAVVADLGCGNGILAAEIASHWDANFELFDASDLAVEAAQRTWQANALGDRMRAHVADGFSGHPDASIDIVITNPPFHQGHALDADMTDRLLADTARVLRPAGVAYVVAQRHLHLHTRLLQWFSKVEVVSKHPSHVVLVATKK